MSKEIYISSTPHETRLAIVENDALTEIYYERENEYTLAGSIYNGKVTRVLPGMQSSFVDIGLERDAFLYITDFMEEAPDSAEFDTAGISDGGLREPREPREPREARVSRLEGSSDVVTQIVALPRILFDPMRDRMYRGWHRSHQVCLRIRQKRLMALKLAKALRGPMVAAVGVDAVAVVVDGVRGRAVQSRSQHSRHRGLLLPASP
jgi:Ribonuclease G/E